jgi:hypothetical protein
MLLDIGKAFDTTWQPGLLHKLPELKFSISLIKLSQRKFRVSVESEVSTPRDTQAEVPQGSVLSPTLYNTYCHVFVARATYNNEV